MRFISIVLSLAVPAAVFGGATHTVTVGEGGKLAFNPTNITAAVGDMVSFEFRAKNHSVTQSTFTSPCTKAMINGTTGINSGFLALPPNMTNASFPTWTIQVSNGSPLWFYCAQKIPKAHCPAGMVFSINATPEKSHEKFLAAAKASANATAAPSDPTAAAGNSSAASGSSSAASDVASGSAATVASSAAAGSAATVASSATAGSAATVAPSAAAGSTGASGTAAAAAASSPSQAGSNVGSSTVPNGASKTALTRSAAGLLTVAAVAAVLL